MQTHPTPTHWSNRYDLSVRVCEWLGVIAFVVTFAMLTAKVAGAGYVLVEQGALPLWTWAIIPIGWLAADAVSGLVHHFCDHVGSPDWPLVGSMFVRPFREHHDEPDAICHHDAIELHGSTAIAALTVLIPVLIWVDPSESIGSIVGASFTLVFLGGIFMTNAIHRWAHLETPPRAARLFQKMRILLTPENHDLHHHAPYDRAFCITSGWLNPIADRLMGKHKKPTPDQ